MPKASLKFLFLWAIVMYLVYPGHLVAKKFALINFCKEQLALVSLDFCITSWLSSIITCVC